MERDPDAALHLLRHARSGSDDLKQQVLFCEFAKEFGVPVEFDDPESISSRLRSTETTLLVAVGTSWSLPCRLSFSNLISAIKSQDGIALALLDHDLAASGHLHEAQSLLDELSAGEEPICVGTPALAVCQGGRLLWFVTKDERSERAGDEERRGRKTRRRRHERSKQDDEDEGQARPSHLIVGMLTQSRVSSLLQAIKSRQREDEPIVVP